MNAKRGMPIQRNIKPQQKAIVVPNGRSDYALVNSEQEFCPIGQTLNGATFLNILFGGVIGLAIDATTGSIVHPKSQVYCSI